MSLLHIVQTGAPFSAMPSIPPTLLPPPSRLVIASRESRLAMWQAESVRAALRAHYPSCEVVIQGMTTRGDQILDRSLSRVGGKGLFVKELEATLLDGRCDLAVHSLKDVPMELGDDFSLAAILPRGDARDALVSPVFAAFGDMPPGTRIGTSSLRREAQIRAAWPHLVIEPLRGNLDTRLAKLDRGEYGAIVLAVAGLQRLGLEARIRAVLEPSQVLPAPGQGTLGIEINARRKDLTTWLAPLHDVASAACALAERAVSRRLGGSCDVPLGAHAILEPAPSSGSLNRRLKLQALVARQDGSEILRTQVEGDANEAEALGVRAAEQLLEQGAARLLALRHAV